MPTLFPDFSNTLYKKGGERVLVASTAEAERISLIASEWSQQDLVQLDRQSGFYCPVCRAPVVLKTGKKRRWHFAHQPHHTCLVDNEPETMAHLSGKEDLFRWCEQAGRSAKLEHYLRQLRQRPDIYLPGIEPVAIEYQCSVIPEHVFTARSNGYLNGGIIPIWIIGAHRYHRQRFALQLSGFTSLAIRQSKVSKVSHPFTTSYYVCFYDSASKNFRYSAHLSPISKTRFISQESTVNLLKLKPYQLLTPSVPFSSMEFKDAWLDMKRKRRLSPPNRLSPEEYALRVQAYQLRINFSYVPGYVGLPHESAIHFQNSPYLWQMWIILLMGVIEADHCFTPERVIRETEERRMERVFSLRCLPLCPLLPASRVIKDYLEQLLCLRIVKKIGNSYRMEGLGKMKQSLTSLFQEDRVILDRLEAAWM